jgi:hypothetical protein
MIEHALSEVMSGEVGRTFGLTGHPHLSMYVTNLGDRPGLLIDVELPPGATIEDGQGFDIVEVVGRARSRVLVRPTQPGSVAPAFLGLVEFVFRETAAAASRAKATEALLDAVHEFRAFFARRTDRLGEVAIRGLFAELELLAKLIRIGVSPEDALHAWSGPYQGTDFKFVDSAAIEVKSTRLPARNVVITSEYQLQVPAGGMHLFVLPLSTLSFADTAGRALLDLVQEVKGALGGSPRSRELWRSAVAAIGFDDGEEYYKQWRFESSDWQAYVVREGFPRIIPESLPTGVSSVGYTIRLETLVEYREDAMTVLEEAATAYV